MGNDWFHEYFINELKAIGRKPTSNKQHEVVDSLPSSGNEQTIYFVKNDSSSSNNHYDEYVWISSSSSFEKIGSTQIDGSTTQPDWNQNDATQPDYIKNRPFYTGNPVETVLIEETTAPFADTGHGFYMAEVASTFVAAVGETYKVSWDGTAYECTCISFNNMPAIGNLSIAGFGSDTGEPFLMSIVNGQVTQIAAADASASHTISISWMVTPVVKIDPKYIRDMYYTDYTEEETLIEQSRVVFKENNGHYVGSLSSTFIPIVGDTYKVLWDGTVYESVCLNFQGHTAIGNLSMIGEGSDTGEPFFIGVGNIIKIRTLDTASSHVISIRGRTTQVVKIDEKYLPDTVATKSEVEAAQSTANNAQSTANNAQSTANNAQNTANNAQNTANNAQTTANNAKTDAANAVSYAFSQQLTDKQKQLARTNIGAGTSSFSRNYNDLTNKPLSLNGLIQSNTGTTQIDVLDYTTNGATIICQTQYILDTSSSIFKRLLNTRIIGYRDNGYTVIYHKQLNSGWEFFDNVQINDVVYYGVGIGENVKTSKDKYLFISNGGFIIIHNSYVSMENPIRYFKIEYSGAVQSIPIAYLSEKFIPPAIQRVGDDLILSSSTEGSTKKFKITVDDTGTISATEVP